MIEERTFIVNGNGRENPRFYQGSREPAPPGRWVELIVRCLSGDVLFLHLQQSVDGNSWEDLGEPESCGLGFMHRPIWPKAGRQVRLAFWTEKRRCAIVGFRVFDNGRAARA